MLNNDQLKTVFAAVVFIVIILQCLIIYYSKKKGVNVEDNKFQLKLGLGAAAIGISVFWFAEDITLLTKLEITFVGFAVGLGSFFTVDRLGRKARRTFNIETSWDKEQRRKNEDERKK